MVRLLPVVCLLSLAVHCSETGQKKDANDVVKASDATNTDSVKVGAEPKVISPNPSDSTQPTILGKDNFEKFITENDKAVILFKADWCPHCQQFLPEYQNAVPKLDEHKIKLGVIDGYAESDLSTKYDIKGFPTVLVFNNGKHSQYTGGRNTDSMVSWLTNYYATFPLWKDNLEEVKQHKSGAVKYILYVKNKDHKLVDAFAKHADENRANGSFYAIVDPGNHSHLQILYNNGEDYKVKFDKESEISEICEKESLPLFAQINDTNYAKYASKNTDFVWFVGNNDDYNAVKAEVSKTARKHRDTLNFVWLNTEKYPNHAKNMFGVSQTPVFVVHREAEQYVPDFALNVTSDSLHKYIEDVKKGYVEKHIKSEPEEASTDPGMVKVVGTNFDRLVEQEERPVLLLVHAPWCHYCQQLMPKYKELAKKFEPSNDIVIAAVDGSSNDIPIKRYPITGFPTLFLKKCKTCEPVLYSGEKSLDGIQGFITTHLEIKVPEAETAEAQSRSDEL